MIISFVIGLIVGFTKNRTRSLMSSICLEGPLLCDGNQLFFLRRLVPFPEFFSNFLGVLRADN
jgi:hypothetical protein